MKQRAKDCRVGKQDTGLRENLLGPHLRPSWDIICPCLSRLLAILCAHTHAHTHMKRPSWGGVETRLCMTNTDSNRCRGPWQSEVWAPVERAPQGWGQGRLCSKCQLGLEADRRLVCRDGAAGISVRGTNGKHRGERWCDGRKNS